MGTEFIMARRNAVSSGTLLYRWTDGEWHVLIVHPSGWYNKGKAWSIPKGNPDEGESLEDAARRETREEAGLVAGDLVDLGEVTYSKSGKKVHCFAGPLPEGEPCCNSWEIDEARFMPLEEARGLLHVDQQDFIDRLWPILKKEART